jgi:Uma2 family endonuclease
MAAEAIASPLRRPSAGTDGWTVDDLAAFPDDSLRYEIIDGVLLVSPSPALPHQRAITRLNQVLAVACPTDLEVFVAPLDWQPAVNRSFEPDLLVVRRLAPAALLA